MSFTENYTIAYESINLKFTFYEHLEYMWQDIIVQKVRKAGEELAKQANNDLHLLFQNLKNRGKKVKYKVVSREKDKITTPTPTATSKST